MAADVADVRVDLALSALAIALGSVSVAAWQPSIPIVLALTALVVIQGAARIGRTRATERQFLVAIGAGDGFVLTMSRVEGAFFGVSAAMVGLLVSSVLVMLGGTWSSIGLTWSAVWLVVATLAGAASASLAARVRRPESGR